MKKILSISLITLILLNTIGYYAAFVGLQIRNDLSLVKSLDAGQYDESRSVTVKIPVAIPYLQDQADFVRVDGTFTHEGNFYRIIKQKYSSDTLTIICYKDHESKVIQNALTDYVKTFTDAPQDSQNNSKIALTFIKDYIGQQFSLGHLSDGWQSEKMNTPCISILQESFTTSINHPPEAA